MPRQIFLFDPPQRFVVGTVGPPGERTFYLQASGAVPAVGGLLTVSVALEKTQVSVLADRLDELLKEVRRRTGAPEPVPVDPDLEPLESPVEEEFRVGAMGLAWDADDNVVVIEAQAATDDPEGEQTVLEDVDEGPDALRVRLSQDMALAFVERVRRVVSAGRPPCPLCGLPLDAGGHVCPRQNGYRRAP